VLVNQMSEEKATEILERYASAEVKFVHGDHTREHVLIRANVAEAESVILLADYSGTEDQRSVDERTVLATLTVKSINPKVKTCAELMNSENLSHLKRAKVDEVVIVGENDNFLLANAALHAGVLQTVKELMNTASSTRISRAEIPKNYVGRKFAELDQHFRSQGDLVIGVVTHEVTKMSLHDIISDDYSAIDNFIKKKFEESKRDFFGSAESKLQVKLNPGHDYIVTKDDYAVVISGGKKNG
jgi:voltage-gated potassium channel